MEAAHHPWPALGALLLRDGLVDSDELEAVLTQQENAGNHRISARRLGELLVERGTVTHAQVAQLLAEQYELPFISLAESDVNLRAAALLPEDQAHRFSALPISVLPDASVLVAVSDPPLVLFSDEFRRLLGVPLRYAVAPQDQLDRAIAYAGPQSARFEAASTEDSMGEVDPDVDAGAEAHDEAPQVEVEPLFVVPEHPRAHRSAALGALLVRDGLVSDKDLEAALAQQRITGDRRLGEILVERGVVTRAQVTRLVAEQYDLPFVEVDPSRVQPEAAALLPDGVAHRLSALPLGFSDDGSLLLVVSDPTNVVYADELREAIAAPIRFAVASPDEIEAAIDAAHERSRSQTVESHLPDAATEQHDPPVEAALSEAVVVVLEDPEPSADDVEPFAYVEDAPAAEVGTVEPEAVPEPTTDDVEPHVADDDEPFAYVEDAPAAEVDSVQPEFPPEPTAEDVVPFLEAAPDPVTDDVPLAAVEDESFTEHEDHAETQLHEDLLAEVEETVAVAVAELDAPETDLGADDSDAELDTTVLEDVDEAISLALSLGAATVQFTPQSRGLVVRGRIDGSIRELGVLPGALQDAVVARIAEQACLGDVRRVPRQGLLHFPTGDRTYELDASTVPTKLGVQLTLRVPDREGTPSSISDLGLSSDAQAALRDALRRPHGVVVVCGPVASGKTTTMYALLQELATPDRALATIEDPVARLVPGVDQVEVDTVSGVTFARGLRAILRSEADVALADELRDGETANVAFRGARADHVVLAALDAPTTTAAVERLGALGVDTRLASATLSCLVAQHLVRRVCSDCRETYYASADEIAELGRSDEESGRRLLARGRGCGSCEGTGFRGWAGVFEVLPLTDRVRELVGEAAPIASLRESAVADGMSTLWDEAVGLCLDGVTTVSEVRQVPRD